MGGGDKCLLTVGRRPILAHIAERLGPQCDALALNANGDPTRFSAFGLPVFADDIPGFAGPLAGLLAGMEWGAASAPLRPHAEVLTEGEPRSTHDLVRASFEAPLRGAPQDEDVGGNGRYLLTVPGDTPFLPYDLVSRLIAARDAEGATIACASSQGRMHPTVGLWPLSLRDDLRAALAEGERSIGRFARRYPLAVVEWGGEPDPFLNVNEPGDLEKAQETRSPSPLAGEGGTAKP